MQFPATTVVVRESVNRTESPVYDVGVPQFEKERSAQIEQGYKNDTVFVPSVFHFTVIWLLVALESMRCALITRNVPAQVPVLPSPVATCSGRFFAFQGKMSYFCPSNNEEK
jgi:hypothetical protein